MKKIIKHKGSHYFEMLTTEEQFNFRRNVIDGGEFSIDEILDSNFDSFLRFVGSCFSYDDTREGPAYWRDIAKSQRDGVSEEDSTAYLLMELIESIAGPSFAMLPDLMDENNKTGKKLLSEMDEENAKDWKKEFLRGRKGELTAFLSMRYKSISQMVRCSFSFGDSKKGRDYWCSVCDLYDSKDAIDNLINDLGLRREYENN